jgi:hypothetical protein
LPAWRRGRRPQRGDHALGGRQRRQSAVRGMCGISEAHIPQRIFCDSDMFRGMRGFRGYPSPACKGQAPPAYVRDARGQHASRTRGRKIPRDTPQKLESVAIPRAYVAGYRSHISRRYPVIYLICQGFYPAAPRAQANRCACARLRPRQATHDCRPAALGPWCGMENSLWHRETS